jgi:hypothetical protein
MTEKSKNVLTRNKKPVSDARHGQRTPRHIKKSGDVPVLKPATARFWVNQGFKYNKFSSHSTTDASVSIGVPKMRLPGAQTEKIHEWIQSKR